MKNLKYIFQPSSVAVIFASDKKGSIGYAIFSNILKSEFNGVVYPVNPRCSNIMSVKTYGSVNDIIDDIDLAILCIQKNAVEEVINQCVIKKVKALVVITSGFKETGSEGKKLEDKIKSLALNNRATASES
ncbi:MAG: CoA-binding protein [Bacteroidota bacterium]